MKSQVRWSWTHAFLVAIVAGVGVQNSAHAKPDAACRADLDGDGSLTVFDFLEFQNEFVQGCPREPTDLQLAGVPLSGYPFFEFTRAFNEGDTIWIAVDPDRFPSIRGVIADIYIVESKSADEWAADPSLNDVRAAGPQEHTFDASSVEFAAVALAGSDALVAGSGVAVSRGYDVVVDVDRDGVLGGTDMIDGRGAMKPDPTNDVNGFSVFVDLTAPGPLATVTRDEFVISGPYRITYPENIADLGPRPIALVVHGAGHSFEWYDYVLEHLASWGWVTMSVTNDLTDRGDPPLRQTELLLAEQSTIIGGVLDGLLDSSRIVWIGHSRGGADVLYAVERLNLGIGGVTQFDADNIALVSAIAAFSADSAIPPIPLQADVGDVNFHMIWGAGDGDITGDPFGGTKAFRHYDRAQGFKHSTYVHGADHNNFNCCGFRDYRGPSAERIGREEAQAIAKATWLALVKHYAEGDADAIDFLTRPWESFRPLGVRETSTIVHMHRPAEVGSGSVTIDDFQTNPSVTQSSSGGAVSIGVNNATEVFQEDGDFTYTWTPTDPANGMNLAQASYGDTSRGLVFEFDGPAFLEFEVPPALGDVSGLDRLSFRVCQGTRHPLTIAELADLTFTVSIIDRAGISSSIDIGVYGGGVEEPFQRNASGTGVGWQNEYETVRIRLQDFLAAGINLDLTAVESIRFDFGPGFGSAQGRLGLDEIEFVRDP